MNDARVTTRSGAVVGTLDPQGIASFLGIPYAAPPVDAARFQPPRPHAPWTEPRDATAYGATAPQTASEGILSEVIPNVIIAGDDYLNLNIWTRDTTASLPVMVFIHGGSWTTGSGAVPGYDGTAFARDGIVLVTINYRLGADGFAWFGKGPANLGLLDQIAALEWVRDEITAFGGDPSNVTVFGESAGGMSIGALLAMPAARGLFRRAIAESGAAHHIIDAKSAILVANRLADILGVSHSREGLASVPIEKLLAAQATLSAEVSKKPFARLWGDVAKNLLAFEPVIDGDSLPERPITAIAEGSARGVELLVGNNSDEALLFFVPSGQLAKTRSWLVQVLAVRFGLPLLRGVRVYRTERPVRSAGHVFGDIATDVIYRIPAIRLAEAHPGTRMYEFAWRSPAFDGELGACHGIELPFVFDNLASPSWAALTEGSGSQAVADIVHAAWIAFARTGDPGWRAYSAEDRAVMKFDEESATVVDEHPATRRIWDGRR